MNAISFVPILIIGIAFQSDMYMCICHNLLCMEQSLHTRDVE